MARFVAYIVHPDPVLGERYELVDMQGRHLLNKHDVMRWLMFEVPRNRPDLRGRRIDVVDLDEQIKAN